jgi:hypothetical protein
MPEDARKDFGVDPTEHGQFKPQNSEDWARLHGFESGIWPRTDRPVLARVAENVHKWTLSDASQLFSVGPSILAPDSVPVLESVKTKDEVA